MSVALTSSSTPTSTRQEPLRVMVVDDSVVIRGLISRWIAAEPDMVVAASLRTGLDAVNQIERVNPDVAVLDIEMPELDGISALPLLLAKKRNLIIIMASTLTRRNAEISFKALSLGASDYIPKPESTREASAAETFHHDLIQKIRSLGAKVRRSVQLPSSPPLAPALDRPRESRPSPAPVAQPQLMRRAFSTQAPRVLLIGSSTGGPQALMTLVADIGAVIDRFPVLITQHMPPTFTTILAEHLARTSQRPAHEAVDGEIVKAGRIYLAPGGRHMRVMRHGVDTVIALDDGPPVDEPIRSTRGACALNARRISCGCATGASGGRGKGSRGRSSTGASGGDDEAGTVRRTLAPRLRIFWIRSWRKVSAAAGSRVLSGFGM
ncbi:MAG TPA: chemotaxis protein CheB [Bradyrhizobium sp.]